MAIQTTYTNARANFAKLCNEVTSNQEVVIINRRGAQDVAPISAAELASLTETAHLLRAPKNKEWRPGEAPWEDERVVAVQIAAAEVELRGHIKQGEGRWDGQRRVWELPRAQVVALGLVKRVVATGSVQGF